MAFDFLNNSIRILHVDDDEQDYIIIRDLLDDITDLNIQLVWVATYEEALTILTRNEHDLCLLDYFLGEHNGLELIKQAKANGSHIPIVMLTGTGSRIIDWEAMKSGVIYYLDKNRMDEFDLERAIRYGIEHAELLRQVRDLNASLEERVEKRTEQLQQANEQLEREIAERERVEAELQQLRAEREDQTLQYIGRPARANVTSNMLGIRSLREAAPETFQKLVNHYEQILDLALHRRTYWVEDDRVSNEIRNLAETMGKFRIGPRDIVEIYNLALKNKRDEENIERKAQAYVEEGRLTLLELMGYLISFYRNNVTGR